MALLVYTGSRKIPSVSLPSLGVGVMVISVSVYVIDLIFTLCGFEFELSTNTEIEELIDILLLDRKSVV